MHITNNSPGFLFSFRCKKEAQVITAQRRIINANAIRGTKSYFRGSYIDEHLPDRPMIDNAPLTGRSRSPRFRAGACPRGRKQYA